VNNNLLSKVMMVAGLAMALAAAMSMFAQDAPKSDTDAKPKVDIVALNAKLDNDFKLLKLQAQVAARDRDNAVLQFQALKAEFDQKTVELNKSFTKANDDLETARKAVFAAFKVKDGDVTFDATKGEFAPPAAPVVPDKK
jgi:hypothetical protein